MDAEEGTLKDRSVCGARIVAGVLAAAACCQAQQPARRLTFDVASVKAFNQTWVETMSTHTPGRFAWTTSLPYLLAYAYHMQLFQIAGNIPSGKDWMVYRVDATMNPSATEDQVRLMLQSLLEDRFRMASHMETKETDGWALSVAKNGPKIHAVNDGEKAPPVPDSLRGAAPAVFEGKVTLHMSEPHVPDLIGLGVTLLQFCEALEQRMNTAVWDETRLKGKYYFEVRYADDGAPMDVDAPPLNAALQEHLGLKITKHKGPVHELFVDHIDKAPTEN